MEFSDYISLLALIISLLTFGFFLYFGLRDRVNLKATSKVYNNGDYIRVKVVNRGRRPAILRMLGGQLDNGSWVGTYIGKESQGVRLTENEYYTKDLYFDDLIHFDPHENDVSEFVSLWFEDSLGKRHPVENSKENIHLFKK